MKKAVIYTLSDSNGDIFYVGCTAADPRIRLAQHVSEAKSHQKKRKTYTSRVKAQKIISINFNVFMTIVEVIDYKESDYGYPNTLRRALNPIEEKWIKYFRSEGYELVNGGSRTKKIMETPIVVEVGLCLSANEILKSEKLIAKKAAAETATNIK